jgi:hypothetical protein
VATNDTKKNLAWDHIDLAWPVAGGGGIIFMLSGERVEASEQEMANMGAALEMKHPQVRPAAQGSAGHRARLPGAPFSTAAHAPPDPRYPARGEVVGPS